MDEDVNIGPIVSASHLASGDLPSLSELEFGLTMAHHAFGRWIVRGMAAAGIEGLTHVDVLVLHSINHRNKAKRLADICFVLNIEDTHIVTYAIKKLENMGLVESFKQGKEKSVKTTDAGQQACLKYAAIREELLVKAVKATGLSVEKLSEVAGYLRAISGHYDQAARAATSL